MEELKDMGTPLEEIDSKIGEFINTAILTKREVITEVNKEYVIDLLKKVI